MADKELTIFLLDASVSSTAYKYVFDTLAAKLLKGLKTDYVTVAVFNSKDTVHAVAETGKFRGIEVLLEFETVSFQGLQKLHQRLNAAAIVNETPDPDCADVVQTVLFASTLFAPTKKKYRCSTDETCALFQVELYPAAKSDTSALDTHEYVVDANRDIVRLERRTSNFVWEKNFQGERGGEGQNENEPKSEVSERKFDKVAVELHSLTPAFKFSNYDLIALDDDLLQATKLPLFSGLDIFGFMPCAQIPYELLTGDAYYIVPEKLSSENNTLNFQAFVEALRTRKLAVLCRLVRKSEKEVEIGAAFPVKIHSHQKYTNCFVFIRLPFKEDEKIGRFPPLNDDDEESFETKADSEKSATLSLLMDDFVNGQLYDSDENPSDDEQKSESEIRNFKVTLKMSDNSKLPLPPKFHNRNRFLRSSPAINRTQAYMRKILLKSLSADNWVDFFESPDFIKDNLKGLERLTNFFNLQNCMAVNAEDDYSGWLVDLRKGSLGQSKRLATELGAEYVQKMEKKKTKTGRNGVNFYQRGNYGADEGTYDEIPDFDF
ncbi:hypothetical protein HF325_006886 [Metschnikowia pulcherrima]|uniref:DNA helicase n=1 Tax=Metschnikowia pulcherrima TaxID=27326 RepID=A0A8H7GLI8_9ASCO|nr:hypothetical protein HF325_006886 [Metschnikowia pulcherrima]